MRVHLFADEAGNLDFSRKRDASRYYILTTVMVEDFAVGDGLLELRRELAWEGIEQGSTDFHAAEERQEVRDRVFAQLAPYQFRVDTTILEKAKTLPRLAANEQRFYQTAWFLHFKYLAKVLRREDELLVLAASVGTKNRQKAFAAAIEDVVDQFAPSTDARTVAWKAASEPCLWVADYCSWAIQRKWERGDTRSYQLIAPKLRSEFDAFQGSRHTHY